MSNSHYLPDNLKAHAKAMIFVDGENLAIRFKELIGTSNPQSYVDYDKNIFVWSKYANIPHHVNCEVVRKHYYTAVQGDTNKLEEVENKLKEIGIESVYHYQNNELQGQETTPTFYLHKKINKPYHIDYAFCSEDLLRASKLEVGKQEDWLSMSDHLPLSLIISS